MAGDQHSHHGGAARNVGARWPHTHSASLGGRKDVGKWPGSRRSWRVGTVRQDGGEIWEPQTGFFCLSTRRPLQPLRHDCIADTSSMEHASQRTNKPAQQCFPRACGRGEGLCLQHSSCAWCFRRPGEDESHALLRRPSQNQHGRCSSRDDGADGFRLDWRPESQDIRRGSPAGRDRPGWSIQIGKKCVLGADRSAPAAASDVGHRLRSAKPRENF